jgi:D-aminoacyl-tRNA deacylase
MRAIVQRVSEASVSIDAQLCGRIDDGLLVYLGVGRDDTPQDVAYLAEKIVHLRIFPDQQQRMNLDVTQVSGSVLIISNFTLYGDARKGRRPSFEPAAPPELAEQLYEQFIVAVESYGLRVAAGRFGAMMQVRSTNAGPVNVLLDSARTF